MKDQGSSLPPGWVSSTIGEVGEVRVGRQRNPSNQSGRYTAKYLRAGNVTEEGLKLDDVLEMDFTPSEREIFRLEYGDILLAEASGSAAHVGRAAIWRDELPECYFQNTLIRFRPRAVESEYAILVFRYLALTGVLASTSKGTGILHLGASRFAGLQFQLPPREEQLRIVQEVGLRLSELTAARTSLRSALEGLGQQATEIIAAAVIGDLVPREADLAEEQQRGFEDAYDLLNRTPASDRNQKFQDPSDAGGTIFPAPSGWLWTTVSDVAEITIGRQRSPQHQQGDYMRPYLRVANVREDYIDFSDILEMNFTPQEYEIYALQWGDILLNEGQSPELVGRPAIYRDEVPGACFQNSLLRFRASPAVDPEFALLVFRYYLHSGEFRKTARWTTNIAHLSLGRFSRMPFPVPPLAEQQRIAAEANSRLRSTRQQEEASRRSLDQLPKVEQELLGQAVSGQIVAQDKTDRPASELLSREDPAPRPHSAPVKRRRSTSSSRTLATHDALPNSSLVETLREAKRPLTLPELFIRAGYNKDSTLHVEHFYLALRKELGHSIRYDHSKENTSVEVISDEAR